MDLKLIRNRFGSDGVFGSFQDQNNKVIFYSGEHAYIQTDGTYLPKLSDGDYRCFLGTHELESNPRPFQCYQIMKVPPFMGNEVTELLVHVGNDPQVNSSGCVLIGMSLATLPNGNGWLMNSSVAFMQFMNLQNGALVFNLTVSSVSP